MKVGLIQIDQVLVNRDDWALAQEPDDASWDEVRAARARIRAKIRGLRIYEHPIPMSDGEVAVTLDELCENDCVDSVVVNA